MTQKNINSSSSPDNNDRRAPQTHTFHTLVSNKEGIA